MYIYVYILNHLNLLRSVELLPGWSDINHNAAAPQITGSQNVAIALTVLARHNNSRKGTKPLILRNYIGRTIENS